MPTSHWNWVGLLFFQSTRFFWTLPISRASETVKTQLSQMRHQDSTVPPTSGNTFESGCDSSLLRQFVWFQHLNICKFHSFPPICHNICQVSMSLSKQRKINKVNKNILSKPLTVSRNGTFLFLIKKEEITHQAKRKKKAASLHRV